MRHPSVSRRGYCVMCAVPTSTGGVPGAMLSKTDRATAAAGEAGSASMTGFSVR
jgi:hypothetical protein